MIQGCLMMGEIQSCVGLMATTLLSLWSVTALSTMTNSLILESLQPWLTIQFLCQYLSSFSGFHFWHLTSLSCAPPTLVWSCALCCGTCVLASVSSPFVLVFPLHWLYCQQFCSLFFCSSFIIFMTLHHHGKWKLYISLSPTKTQLCVARGERNKTASSADYELFIDCV